MANDVENVVFRRGPSSTIPSTKVPGTILIETDTGRVYVDDTESSRIQLKDDTKLPLEGTAKKSESDVNGNSLVGRITTIETDAATGVVTFKNEKGESKGTAVNSSYVDNATAQSDWNQNDETKSDYIKNRPFFAGDLVNAELADIAQIISDGGFGAQIVPMGENSFVVYNSDTITIPNVTITIGDTYSFLIDGVKYTYVAVDYEGNIAFGDIAELSNQNYSELNFVVIGENRSSSFNTGIILFRGSAPPNEFKLIGQTQEIKKIDDKYLPDSVKNSEITINGKTIDKSNSLELIPSDIGASKIIYIEENNKRVAETISEIKGYTDSGYDVRLIANSFGGIHMIRLKDNYYVNISLVGDLHRLVVYSAFISSAGTVNFINWKEGNWYPDTHEREIELSKDIEGNWVCNYNLEDIKRILTYHPILIVGLSDLGIPSASEGANVRASKIRLLLTGNEQPVMDSPVKKQRYVFSGTYGDYNITVIIGPNNSSNITVRIEENGSATVDSSLSDTSTNPVQNKVIKSYIDSITIDDGSID